MSSIQPNTVKVAGEGRAKHMFTVEEANRALVLVRRIVVDVIVEYSRMLDLQEALEVAEAKGAREQYDQARIDLIRSAGRLRTCLGELEDVGVELKDWSLGLVDFPCIAGGREVCLSWQYGQDEIAHWHEVESSFANLEPIDTLPVAGQYAAHKPAPRRSRRRSGLE